VTRTLTTVVVALGLALGGCASTPPAAAGGAASAAEAAPVNKADPWENWNRKVYAFNDTIDAAVVKPVAEAYRNVVPQLVRTGVGNVLGNIRDVWSAANQLLQGKLQYGLEMGMRVASNTFFGIGGLLDPATEFGLVRRSEDFGQTLGRWGAGPGPFVVLPLLGPSTLRDTIALPVDRLFAPTRLPQTDTGTYAVLGIEIVDARTNLLETTQLLDQVALDRYSFTRDAYLQRRRDQVYDGAPPLDSFDDEPADGAPDAAPAAAAPASAPASAAQPK